jgi:hypothetical protein
VCRSELDDAGEPDHYQERFTAVINVFVAEDECHSTKQPPWIGHTTRSILPDCLFSTRIEQDENFDTFGKFQEVYDILFISDC